MCSVCILRSCCPACSDSPNRLISNGDLIHLSRENILETDLDLSLENFLKLAAFSFLESLTYAEDNLHLQRDSKKNLAIDNLICLSVILTSLAVSENDSIHTDIKEHLRRNLSCVSSRKVVCHVLCADSYIRSLYSFYDTWEGDERRCNHDTAVSTGLLYSLSKR